MNSFHDDIPTAAEFEEYSANLKFEWAKNNYYLLNDLSDADWGPPEKKDAVEYIEDNQIEDKSINDVLEALRVWWANGIRIKLEKTLSSAQLRF